MRTLNESTVPREVLLRSPWHPGCEGRRLLRLLLYRRLQHPRCLLLGTRQKHTTEMCFYDSPGALINFCLYVRKKKILILSSPQTQSNKLTDTAIYAAGVFTDPKTSEVVWSDAEGVLRDSGQRPWRMWKGAEVRCGMVRLCMPTHGVRKGCQCFISKELWISPFVLKRGGHV